MAMSLSPFARRGRKCEEIAGYWLLRLRRLMCGKLVAFRQAAQPK
jgi:hypothetical protein